MSVTTRTRRRGEHGMSRKTIARGMPGNFRCTCGDYTRVLFLITHEAAGASSARHSLRPLFYGRTFLANLGRSPPRERGVVACHSGAMRSIEPGISRFSDVQLHI